MVLEVDKMKRCPICDGAGEFEEDNPYYGEMPQSGLNPEPPTTMAPCMFCNTTGYVDDEVEE